MAIGISRKIGIGMKKCCGGGVITPPPPSPFPLRFINTSNVPPPSGCDVFDASISITRNGTTFLASEMTKTSNNTSTTTVDPISVYATDIVEVRVQAFAITDPTCSSSVNTTTARMDVGNAFNSPTVATVTSNDSPPTATYQFSPVQGSLDLVNIKGSSSYVAPPPPSTLELYLETLKPTSTGCEHFVIRVYDTATGSLLMQMTKTSGNTAIIASSPVTIPVGTEVEVAIDCSTPSSVQCQYDPNTQTGYFTTDVLFSIKGSQGGTAYNAVYTGDTSGQTIMSYTYTYIPVDGVSDIISADGTPVL